MDASSPKSTLGVLALVVALLAGFALLPRVFAHEVREAPDFTLDVATNGSGLVTGAGAGAATAGPGTAAAPSSVKLSELRGNAILLDFWATWCQPCRAEAPIVDRVSRRWRDKGVVVVGVNEDKPDEGDPVEFAREAGLTYPILRDPRGTAMHAFGADSLPTLVVVSRTGKVIAERSGITSDAELERLVRQAL
jgi:cytochrome c biogenesis protein CcmG, thiol:disulfide interchange protein DsbE